MEAREEQLWIGYQLGDGGAREQLLRRYMPLAKRQAAIVYASHSHGEIDFGDYLQLAYVGLLEAMQRYKHESAAQFSTYATYRIRGSILNGIPKMTERGDYVSYLRRAQRERTASLLENKSSVAPGLASFYDLVVGIALTYQLDELVAAEGVEVQTEPEPYASRSYDEMQRCLKDVLDHLPERDRQIVYYHYFCQMSFDEIANVFALTRGRISQLHKAALDAIREALRRRQVNGLY